MTHRNYGIRPVNFGSAYRPGDYRTERARMVQEPLADQLVPRLSILDIVIRVLCVVTLTYTLGRFFL